MPCNIQARLLDSVTWCWLYRTFNNSLVCYFIMWSA